MKKLLFLMFVSTNFCHAQIFHPIICNDLRRLDVVVSDIDKGIYPAAAAMAALAAIPVNGYYLSYPQLGGRGVQLSLVSQQVLLPLIGYHPHTHAGPVQNVTLADLPFLLDCITHTETITWIQNQIENDIKTIPAGLPPNPILRLTKEYKEQQLAIVNQRLMEIMEEEFTNYGFSDATDQWLKWFSASHANDVLFALKRGINDDRDLTGAFRFEAATDKFKMRLMPAGLWSGTFSEMLNWNSRNWYSYQSIFVGGEGYTPYLRDTCVFNSPTAVDSLDRPYASTRYFGRAKYRVTRLGRVAVKTEFKVGSIGKPSQGAIQAALHRDIAVSSVTPAGWESQIANGGRLMLSYQINAEWLWFKERKSNNFWLHPSAFIDAVTGHDNTSASVGFTLSNMNLRQRGGINMNTTNTGWDKWLTFCYTFSGRYVWHNSMLEGYGWLRQQVDEDPNSPSDAYVLRESHENGDRVEIHRLIWRHDFTLNLMLGRMGIIFKQSVWSPEFEIERKGQKLAEYKNWNAWNHVGTLGLLWRI